MRLRNLFRRKIEFGITQSVSDAELIGKFAYPGHPLLDGLMCVLDKHFSEMVNNAMEADSKEMEGKAVAGMEALMAYKADVEDYLAASLDRIRSEAGSGIPYCPEGQGGQADQTMVEMGESI